MSAPPQMQVLFCADEAYLEHAAVAALSLLSHCGAAPVTLHLMTLSPASEKERLFAQSLAGFDNARLDIHRVKDARMGKAHVDRHLSQAAYLRFLAPEVLCRLSRVIYLDCDLVVCADLHALWHADLAGRPVGAVRECQWDDAQTRARLAGLGIGADHIYVNSGVLVMDLAQWRQKAISRQLFDFIAARGAQLTYHDQDALNAVLQGQIAPLERRWNVQAMFFGRWFRSAMAQDFAATRSARRRPGIIHYTTEKKPWLAWVPCRKRALYHRYRDRTAWRDLPKGAGGWARVEKAFVRLLWKLGLDPYMLPLRKKRG